jgi:ABC-2 type transport system ATP-binding protein
MTKKTAVSLNEVAKKYQLLNSSSKNDFYALKNINLEINKGEKIAVLGENGAGKTTLLKIIAGITKASSGQVKTNGKVISLISLTAGFHQEFSGRENIYLNAALLGMRQAEVRKLEDKIIEFSGISDFIDQPLFTYSSGMVLRLGFAVAIHADPDILILDESIIVGDQDFQAQAYQKIEELFEKGKTIIVSSHMLSFLKRLCNRFLWMEKGEIKMSGGEEVLTEYQKNKYKWWQEDGPDQDQPSEVIFEILKNMKMGEKFVSTAASSSMEPFIMKGDLLEIKRVNFEELKKGEVIAFWDKHLQQIVVHRFKKISRDGKTIITQGDANGFGEKINQENFLGVLLLNVN